MTGAIVGTIRTALARCPRRQRPCPRASVPLPPRRMHRLPAEALATRHVGSHGLGERMPRTGHEDAGRQGGALARLDDPDPGALVDELPSPRCRSGCANGRRTCRRSARDTRGSLPAARRSATSWGWARTSSSRDRRDVAGDPRIRVVAPGAAEPIGRLEDGEVIDALLLQANRHAEPGEPRSDDDHVIAVGRRRSTAEIGDSAGTRPVRGLHRHGTNVAFGEWQSTNRADGLGRIGACVAARSPAKVRSGSRRPDSTLRAGPRADRGPRRAAVGRGLRCSRCPTRARRSGTSRTRPGSSRRSCSRAPAGLPPASTTRYGYLFNSYYEAVGAASPARPAGLLSRPVSATRSAPTAARVDERMRALPGASATRRPVAVGARSGSHHEQQHQELILTDVKHALARQPASPAPTARPSAAARAPAQALEWLSADGRSRRDRPRRTAASRSTTRRPRHRVFADAFLARRPDS